VNALTESRRNATLLDVIKRPVKTIQDIQHVQILLKERGVNEVYYKAFHPLIRIKGHIHKVHASRLSRYMRYLYLNPIEGVLISYKTVNKFPHIPNVIIYLN